MLILRRLRLHLVCLFLTACFMTAAVEAQVLSIVAGTGVKGFAGENGQALDAQLNDPVGIAFDTAGNLYIADAENHRIRRVTTAGVISTFAGTGGIGFSGDGGQALNATFFSPRGLAFDAAGNLFVADIGNQRIRRIATNGTVSTIAGTGFPSFSGDGGPAVNANIRDVSFIAFDGAGNLYLSDTTNHRIRRIGTNGIINTVAGNGSAGFSGDGGAATAASINRPMGLTVDASGNVYFADQLNHRIRRINAAGGAISTVAGNGSTGFTGDGGTATSATLWHPTYVLFDSTSNAFYVADGLNFRVRKFTVGGTMTTVAGNGTQGTGSDNVIATMSTFNTPYALARNAIGVIHVTDINNARIRKIRFAPSAPAVTGVVAVPNGIRVSFSPNSLGGAQSITGFTASCAAATGSPITASGTTSPITVTGLTPETLHTCTIQASNAHGLSLPSAPSSALAPIYATVVTITAPSTSIIGQTPTFTATVTGNPPVTGTLTFKDGANNIANCVNLALNAITQYTATATCTVSGMNIAVHTITGVYSGNAGTPGNPATTSPNFNHEVLPVQPQTITYTPPNRPSNAGTFTTTATGGPSGQPVTFVSLTPRICLSSGTNGESIRLTGLLGSCTIRASQAATPFYFAAPDVTATFQVESAAPGMPILGTAAGTGVPGAPTGANGNYGPLTALGPVGAVAYNRFTNEVYFVERVESRVRKMDQNGIVTTVAGAGFPGFGGDGGPAVQAALNQPEGIAINESDGTLYISDTGNHRIRKVDAGGIITTIAGTGVPGYNGDFGNPTTLQLNKPMGIALRASTLYIADNENHRVRRLSPGLSNMFTEIGNGIDGVPQDGQPNFLALGHPRWIVVDQSSNIYVASEHDGQGRLMRFPSSGQSKLLAGGGTLTGKDADGGMATDALIGAPLALAVDTSFGTSSGYVYLSERDRGVRKITPNGRIVPIAGNGLPFSFTPAPNGGDATQATLSEVLGLAVDQEGHLYLGENFGLILRKVTFPPFMTPAAPIITQQSAGNTQITIDFRGNFDGGLQLAGYEVSCGSNSANVSWGPVTLSGLTNGTGYNCTVRARNDAGLGAAATTMTLVPKAPSTTTLTGPAASLFGMAATFTATVTTPLENASGQVRFMSNGNTIAGCGLQPVLTGVATCTKALPAGTHQVTAEFTGAGFITSSSNTVEHVVTSSFARRNDVTGNGTSDVIWYHTGVFGVIGMNANGLALDPYYIIDVQSDANWKIVGLGDLNGDGRADLVWYNSATGEAYGLLLDGGTTVGEGRIHLEPNLDWKPEQVADVNGDGRADIVWKNQASGSVFVMLMNGLTQSGGQVVYTEPNLSWKIMASGDMNGDGRADLLWRNVATGDVFSMLMDGFTVLSGGVIYTEPNLNWKIIGLADFNNDTRADVLWQNTATGDVFEMQMNGTLVSAGQVIYNEPNTDWKIVALGDYNGDGRADILWQNTVTGMVYMMLMDEFTVTGANFVYTEPDTQWRIVGP